MPTRDSADMDSFCDSDSESSAGSEYDSSSHSGSSASDFTNEDPAERQILRGEQDKSNVSKVPVTNEPTSSEVNRNAFTDAALHKLQSLRERRRSSTSGLKDVRHNGHPELAPTITNAEPQSNNVTQWPHVASASPNYSDAARNTSLPAECSQAVREQLPPPPLADSVALPSTSAWFVNQKQNGQHNAIGATLSRSVTASAPAMHCNTQQTSCDTPSIGLGPTVRSSQNI
jgi:hypothetical protein